MKPPLPAALPGSVRRRLLGAGALGLSLGAIGLPARAANRNASRARFRLSTDFSVPPLAFGIVPWDQTEFLAGGDISLQSDGKVLFNTAGLYEMVFSCDWDAKSGNDIDLRKIGIRKQAVGQPDTPIDDHERLGFFNMPGSDPPAIARFQGAWAPPPIALGKSVSFDVGVTPTGLVSPGDSAMASHTSINRNQLPDDALTALVVQAKVIDSDTVRVTLFNPSVTAGISLTPGTLQVMAMTAERTRGSSGDTWMVMHTASVHMQPGDKIYGLIQHKVTGTLLQATKSSYLQIDKLD